MPVSAASKWGRHLNTGHVRKNCIINMQEPINKNASWEKKLNKEYGQAQHHQRKNIHNNFSNLQGKRKAALNQPL